MGYGLRIWVPWCLVLLIACDGADPSLRDGGGDTPTEDADGDGIRDDDEGAPDVDTDSDGQPDFRDPDADGDGLSDAIEAGDANLATPPVDSDGDGVPDFRDLDSDDNGLLDAIEGTGDQDGEGTLDFADPDDDGDTLDDVIELRGAPTAPPDTDEDGTPDFRDIDADGDRILDADERDVDPDADEIPAYLDLDADGDSLPDNLEAGDNDLDTPPVDTDGDATPDFVDADSDDDGLADDLEVGIGTSPTREDSDDDGITDLIEYVAASDPTDGDDSPRGRGDFVFRVPFQEPPDPPQDTLRFRTGIRSADLYFSFDTSTTMAQEVAALRDPVTGVPGIIDALRCAEGTTDCDEDEDCAADEVCGPRGRCAEDPAENACLLDLATGVGRWDHIDSFQNLLGLQGDPAATAAALPSATEFWVAPLHAVACVADGDNCTNPDVGCAASGVGCPGFRERAVRILFHITDANDECLCGTGTVFPCDPSEGPAARCAMFSTSFAGNELRRRQIRLIGLIGNGPAYGEGDATDQAESMAIASGSVDGDGAPFVYSATDAQVVDRTVEAVRALVSDGRFEYAILPTDEPDDDGDALVFIERLAVNQTEPGCSTDPNVRDTNGDSVPDIFLDARPGERLCWDIVVRRNQFIRPTRAPQVFRARLEVFADGSEVDERIVYFLVPGDLAIPPLE